MRIQFNGIIEKKSGGCGACGNRSSSSQFLTTKTYILPSKSIKTFRVGVPEEVSEQDGQFLLQYKYLSNGEEKKVFEWLP